MLRPHQSDTACLRQVFVDGECDLSRVGSEQRSIDIHYKSILCCGRVPVIFDGGKNIRAGSKNVGKNVTPFKAALGAEAGFVELVVQEHAAWATQTLSSDKGLKIVTLDELVTSVPGGELFIVEIDIEGFEKDLFATNISWIERAFLIYVEPHDWILPDQGTSGPFMRAIIADRFEVHIIGENLAFACAEGSLM